MISKKKLVYLNIIILTLALLSGCRGEFSEKDLEGHWQLETLTEEDGKIISVGKSYPGYGDWTGEKEDTELVFMEDNSFKLGREGKEDLGKYRVNKNLDLKDSLSITMVTDHGEEIVATAGIRNYDDGKEAKSLIFQWDKKIYSFIKDR